MKVVSKKVEVPQFPQEQVISEPINDSLLTQLRNMNTQIELIKNNMQATIGGYIVGRGLSLETHEVNFNIESGIMQIKQK